MEKIGSIKFLIEPGHCDINGRANLTYLLDQMLKLATVHADSHGFGYRQLSEQNLAWVISRIGIFCQHYPSNNDEIELITWVSSFDRFFVQRNFACIDSDGKVIVKAVSFWAAIDIQTRRPANLMELQSGHMADVITCPEQDIVLPRLFKIPSVELPPVLSYVPQYSDIDINRHFNSLKYVEHALNLFSADLLSGTSIQSLEIVYLAEILPNMQINFHKDNNTVELKNAANAQSMCRMRIQFS